MWKPVGLLAMALVWYGGTVLIGLRPEVLRVLLVAVRFFAVVAAVWTAFRMIDLLASYLLSKARRTRTRYDDLLIPLISRTLKVFAVCMGAIAFAEAFDLPLAGLLSGLGLGGLAVALAAKDALGNLFGSVTVLVDRPFEIGDWIKTGDIEGTVEMVGMRSTRVRTFYNSQITLPNSLLTTAVVDNLGRRRYRRIKTMLSLEYGTPPEKIDAFCEGVRELIRRHPYTRKDYYHVYLNQFSGSSLDVLLYCFLECPDWAVELRERHRLFVDVVKLAARLGVSFAFPTRTLHLYEEQASPHAPLEVPAGDAEHAGRRLAAQIAGKPPAPGERPGPVEFLGPLDEEPDVD
jgi:MscS family membrane protein